MEGPLTRAGFTKSAWERRSSEPRRAGRLSWERGAAVPAWQAEEDFKLAGGRRGREKLLPVFLPPPPLAGAEVRLWTRAEPQQRAAQLRGGQTRATWSRAVEQGAGAALTGRSLRSHWKVQQVQVFVTQDQQFP